MAESGRSAISICIQGYWDEAGNPSLIILIGLNLASSKSEVRSARSHWSWPHGTVALHIAQGRNKTPKPSNSTSPKGRSYHFTTDQGGMKEALKKDYFRRKAKVCCLGDRIYSISCRSILLNKFCPPSSSDEHCLLFCIYLCFIYGREPESNWILLATNGDI